jgi:biotin synthase
MGRVVSHCGCSEGVVEAWVVAETASTRELERWLREDDARRVSRLRCAADATRAARVGDQVHLRGLLEISNRCDRHCLYCGVRGSRDRVSRYRMTEAEILEGAHLARSLGFGTVVLQSGEDHGLDVPAFAGTLERIKAETGLAVTLSLGELPRDELARLRDAGADRYLLRFETSDRRLFDLVHPASRFHERRDRVEVLGWLKDLGYEVGSGVMIGIPGQSHESLAADIALFRELDLDMVGVGPYIPHADTPLGRDPGRLALAEGEQVPASVSMTHRVLALTRLVRPWSNIPSTTALATLDRAGGHAESLRWGANVVMPNLTPRVYREGYEIYPDKAAVDPVGVDSDEGISATIRSIGRRVGRGRGDSPNAKRRRARASCAGNEEVGS